MKNILIPLTGIPAVRCIMVLAILIFAMPAFARTDKADLLIGMKVLPLLSEKIVGTAKLAIVFDPAKPSSKEEAENIQEIMSSNFIIPGDIKLVPVLVPVTDLGMIADSKIAIITEDLSRHYDDISRAAGKGRILTMSTDLACVRASKCILGIVSKPRVEIYYSPTAAESSGISFAPAFIMLVKQI